MAEMTEHAQVRIGASGLACEVRAGGHTLVADEPVAIGGTNTGPNPYDLLLSALGACTCMTLRLYAERKGWPLDSVDVSLSHTKLPVEEVEGAATERGKVDVIERKITLGGALDEEQRLRLLDIANKCPVHRTLNSEVVVRSSLV